MRNKRLPIDLDGLWANDNEHFTVRYKDIATKQKKLLAQKIKANAHQYSIRKTTGPTTTIIEETLEEINPIIFSEYLGNSNWYTGYKKFGTNAATHITGYKFQKLCQAIFLLTCRKKALTIDKIKRIALLTYNEWETIEPYVNQRLNVNDEDEYDNERIEPIEDIGIDDIQHARENTELRRGNRENNRTSIIKGINHGFAWNDILNTIMPIPRIPTNIEQGEHEIGYNTPIANIQMPTSIIGDTTTTADPINNQGIGSYNDYYNERHNLQSQPHNYQGITLYPRHYDQSIIQSDTQQNPIIGIIPNQPT